MVPLRLTCARGKAGQRLTFLGGRSSGGGYGRNLNLHLSKVLHKKLYDCPVSWRPGKKLRTPLLLARQNWSNVQVLRVAKHWGFSRAGWLVGQAFRGCLDARSWRFRCRKCAGGLGLASLFTGHFYSDQAKQGEAIFQQKCAGCHGAGLSGGMGPALKDAPFWNVWADLPARQLYSRIISTMPGGSPASLQSGEVLSIIAFILQNNGFASGSKSLDTPDQLAGVTFKRPAGMSQAQRRGRNHSLGFRRSRAAANTQKGCAMDKRLFAATTLAASAVLLVATQAAAAAVGRTGRLSGGRTLRSATRPSIRSIPRASKGSTSHGNAPATITP